MENNVILQQDEEAVMVVNKGHLKVIVKRTDCGYVTDIYDCEDNLISTTPIWDDEISMVEEGE